MQMAFFTTVRNFFLYTFLASTCDCCLLSFCCMEKIWFPHNPLWLPEVVMRCPLNLLFSRLDKQLAQCVCAYLMFQFPHSISSPWFRALLSLAALSSAGQSLFGIVKPKIEQSFSAATSQVPSRGEWALPSPSSLPSASGSPGCGCPCWWKGTQLSQVCPSLFTCAVTVSLMAP